jgi:hypothetical protein
MMPLAEGTAGLALAIGIALLCAWRIEAASILLAAQSAAVAVTAVLLDQPLMALVPLVSACGLLAAGLFGGGARVARYRTAAPDAPAENAAGGIVAGFVLAMLGLSHDGLGLPLAILLLAVLFGATRRQPQLQLMALIAAQNGLVLAGCLVVEPAILSPVLLPVVCLVLPLPLLAHLLIPVETQRAAPAWSGRVDLALSIAMFAATLIVPLDGFASIFAPLLGFDAVVRAWVRRNRRALSTPRRVFALLQSSLILLAVCAPSVILAWLGVFGAMTAFLLPRLRTGPVWVGFSGSPAAGVSLSDRAPLAVDAAAVTSHLAPVEAAQLSMPPGAVSASTLMVGDAGNRRLRWDEAILAFTGAATALFGLLMLSAMTSAAGFCSLFAGFATVAAIVPDLAVVLVIVLLRLGSQSSWPPGAEAVGSGIALIALVWCALHLNRRTRPHRPTLLALGQCCIAFVAICTGEAEGRFAALVLLVLIILTRSAARVTGGLAATLALAGLSGIPPLGVFPGLVLVAMAVSGSGPWLLLPLAAALVPMCLAGLPRHRLTFPFRPAIPSVGWLPLALALLAGYCAPNGLVLWWHILTAGRS